MGFHERSNKTHNTGTAVWVGGVALAPHRQVDVKALDVDLYVNCNPNLCMVCSLLVSPPNQAFSWSKVYGPPLAQLYVSSRVHDPIQSLGHFSRPTDTLNLKLNFASANNELTKSIPQVVEYFGSDPSTTWVQIAEHEERLQRILLEFLQHSF